MSASGRQRGLQWSLLVGALVLVVALLRSWQMDRTREASEAVVPPLAKGESAAVSALRLTMPEARLVLTRDAAGEWRLVEPVADLASARQVRELLRSLETLEVTRVLDTGEREAYGLGRPQAELTIERLTGGPRRVTIGDPVPSASAYYATWDGLPGVALIPGFIVSRFFLSTPFFWRERELLPPGAPVDSVWVVSAGGDCRARRSGRESWEFTRPRDREPDEKALERAVSALWRYPFLDFYDGGDPAALGLAPPRAVWTYFRDGRVDTLRIGRLLEGGEMVAQVSGRAPGRVAGELYDLLTGGLERLESRRFLRGSSAGVERVLVATRAGGALFARSGKRWRQAPLPAERARELAVDAPPDTAGWNARWLEDPSFDGDLANLFETSGEARLPAGMRAFRLNASDFDLRCDLWSAAGGHQWIGLASADRMLRGAGAPPSKLAASPAPDGGTGSGGAQAAELSGAEVPGLAGLAAGSRDPGRSMWVDSSTLRRMALRAGRGSR